MSSCHDCVFADFEVSTIPNHFQEITPGEPEKWQCGCQFDLIDRWREKYPDIKQTKKDHIEAYQIPITCPFHRDEGWASKQEDVMESIDKETRLHFSLITILDNVYDMNRFIYNIKKINQDDNFLSIQIIDNTGVGALLHDETNIREQLIDVKRWDIFIPLEEMSPQTLVNMMVKRVKTTYYYVSFNGEIDDTIIYKANKAMFTDLNPPLAIRGVESPLQKLRHTPPYICQTLAHNIIGGNSTEWVYDRIAKEIEREKENEYYSTIS